MDLAIVCDFDGTVARSDVGNSFFRTFALPPWEDVVREWEEGRIGSRECLEKESALTTATLHDLEDFASRQEIDTRFPDLVKWARDRWIPLCIVSDGFREYIHRILARHELDVPVFANRVSFEGSRLQPAFPYYELGCGRCANCKGYHVGRFSSAGYHTVFIGDGLSDLCALPGADVILAKGYLADRCGRKGIPHTRIADLGEALEFLSRE